MGGFIPENLLDTRLCYEELEKVGAGMGDAIVILEDGNCIVDALKYFVDFLKDGSCGKCISCKESLRRVGEVLDDILKGNGKNGDIELIRKLSNYSKNTSLCQLGKNIYKPINSATEYFRDEFEEHIHKKCRAGRCFK